MKTHLPDRNGDKRIGGFGIACAALSLFVALAGIGMALSGLVLDHRADVLAGAAMLAGGIASLVVTLNQASGGKR